MIPEPIIPVWVIDLSDDWVAMEGDPARLTAVRQRLRGGRAGPGRAASTTLVDLLAGDLAAGWVQMLAYLPGGATTAGPLAATLTVRIGGDRRPDPAAEVLARQVETTDAQAGPMRIDQAVLLPADRTPVVQTTLQVAPTAHPNLPVELVGRTTDLDGRRGARDLFTDIAATFELV